MWYTNTVLIGINWFLSEAELFRKLVSSWVSLVSWICQGFIVHLLLFQTFIMFLTNIKLVLIIYYPSFLIVGLRRESVIDPYNESFLYSLISALFLKNIYSLLLVLAWIWFCCCSFQNGRLGRWFYSPLCEHMCLALWNFQALLYLWPSKFHNLFCHLT